MPGTITTKMRRNRCISVPGTLSASEVLSVVGHTDRGLPAEIRVGRERHVREPEPELGRRWFLLRWSRDRAQVPLPSIPALAALPILIGPVEDNLAQVDHFRSSSLKPRCSAMICGSAAMLLSSSAAARLAPCARQEPGPRARAWSQVWDRSRD